MQYANCYYLGVDKNNHVTKPNPFSLLTTSEIEEKLGKKYFYKQRLYRLVKKNKIPELNLHGKPCYLGSHVLNAFLKELDLKIQNKFPELASQKIRVFYDIVSGKRIVVDGLFGKSIAVETDEETEDDLLNKIQHIIEWSVGEPSVSEDSLSTVNAEEVATQEIEHVENTRDQGLTHVLPEEIFWVRVDTKTIEDVEVKSLILISLPSISQFCGIRSDKFIEWIAQTTFKDFVLSAHHKHLQGTGISVPWKKGVVSGYVPLVPFELIPEIIVAFKQSGRSIEYPEKADMLYKLAKNTLESVGLAISGNEDRAAEELAKVSRGLGISAANQVIAIFKQYETRDFQIKTTKEFHSKIKQIGGNYGLMIGKLTLGITGRFPSAWIAYGVAHGLPRKITASGREVMRSISPGDGVGMAFGERDFVKNKEMDEAIETGRQGKDFYNRLKKVGLLE